MRVLGDFADLTVWIPRSCCFVGNNPNPLSQSPAGTADASSSRLPLLYEVRFDVAPFGRLLPIRASQGRANGLATTLATVGVTLEATAQAYWRQKPMIPLRLDSPARAASILVARIRKVPVIMRS